MNSTIRKLFGVLTVAIGLMLLTGCQPTGIVVSTEDGKLTIHYGPDQMDKTYEVAPDAKIMRDGHPATLEELAPGDSVMVSTKQAGDKTVAADIEARSPQAAEQPALEEPSEDQPTEEQPVEDEPMEEQPAATEDSSPSDEPQSPPAADEPPATPEEGAPALEEDGGESADEPKVEGEATPPKEDKVDDGSIEP
jgi:hypothetical protein